MRPCRCLHDTSSGAPPAGENNTSQVRSWLAWGMSGVSGFIGQGSGGRPALPEPPSEEVITELQQAMEGGSQGMKDYATKPLLQTRVNLKASSTPAAAWDACLIH